MAMVVVAVGTVVEVAGGYVGSCGTTVVVVTAW